MAEWFQPVMGHPIAPTTVMINLGLNDSKDGEANVPTYEKWVRQCVEELRATKMNWDAPEHGRRSPFRVRCGRTGPAGS